jgi:hypothetical protein
MRASSPEIVGLVCPDVAAEDAALFAETVARMTNSRISTGISFEFFCVTQSAQRTQRLFFHTERTEDTELFFHTERTEDTELFFHTERTEDTELFFERTNWNKTSVSSVRSV